MMDQGPRDMHPGMDRGPGLMDRGMDRLGPMDNRGPGPMDRGPGPMDRGPGPMDRGPGPMDRGPGPMDRGPGPMDRGGPGMMDRGGPMDHRGPGPMERGHGPMDRRMDDMRGMDSGGPRGFAGDPRGMNGLSCYKQSLGNSSLDICSPDVAQPGMREMGGRGELPGAPRHDMPYGGSLGGPRAARPDFRDPRQGKMDQRRGPPGPGMAPGPGPTRQQVSFPSLSLPSPSVIELSLFGYSGAFDGVIWSEQWSIWKFSGSRESEALCHLPDAYLCYHQLDSLAYLHFLPRLPLLCKCCSCQKSRLLCCLLISGRASSYSRNRYLAANELLLTHVLMLSCTSMCCLCFIVIFSVYTKDSMHLIWYPSLISCFFFFSW